MKILVTGGAGFIGSALIRLVIAQTGHCVVNVDALTYAALSGALAAVEDSPRYCFEHVDIRDRAALDRVLRAHRPDGVIHLAAESHVDRSIAGPADFVSTNVNGTLCLLEATTAYLRERDPIAGFRFLHVSTDEVYGSLGDTGRFTEDSVYAPSSPYAASKAAADHLVHAWHRTYGVPTLTTHGSNTFGPFQFPEKLVPLMTLNALAGRSLPVYGRGEQARDWLYVDDHARALLQVFEQGQIGSRYNIAAGHGYRNIDVVRAICRSVDELTGRGVADCSESLIEFVADRPGHDWRYALDTGRIRSELGWQPTVGFEAGIAETVRWYAAHPHAVSPRS